MRKGSGMNTVQNLPSFLSAKLNIFAFSAPAIRAGPKVPTTERSSTWAPFVVEESDNKKRLSVGTDSAREFEKAQQSCCCHVFERKARGALLNVKFVFLLSSPWVALTERDGNTGLETWSFEEVLLRHLHSPFRSKTFPRHPSKVSHIKRECLSVTFVILFLHWSATFILLPCSNNTFYITSPHVFCYLSDISLHCSWWCYVTNIFSYFCVVRLRHTIFPMFSLLVQILFDYALMLFLFGDLF